MTADGDAIVAARAITQPVAATLHGRAGRRHITGEDFLAADVGGTHARIALVRIQSDADAVPEILSWRVYTCAEHAGLAAIVRAFCAGLGKTPARMVLACAGYVHEGVVVNDNLAWPVEPAALARTLALEAVHVLNDFEALAHALAHVDREDSVPLLLPCEAAATDGGARLVLGPGTGLGVAVQFPGGRPSVLATEAGQIQLAARSGRERAVYELLARGETHVPCERVLSGPGLLRLYRALCELERTPPQWVQPATVSAAATAGSDVLAVEALQLFCGWLGSFAGDLAMLYGARGGVYVAGGFMSGMARFVQRSPFAERFLDKGVMRPYLRGIPVHVVDHGRLGVIGAARWLLAQSPLPRASLGKLR